MPAGAMSGGYQKQLGDLPWRKLHPEKGTAPFLEAFKASLQEDLQPDYVLIDSRTGLSDIGGLSTHQLADMVVLVFNLTRSSLEGSVRTYRSFVSPTSKARFLQLVASPVPPMASTGDSVVESRLAYAREHMPIGVAYGRTILRIDYNPAMALSEELPIRQPEVFPAAERYEALREAIQRANPEEVFPVLEQARELRSTGNLEDGLTLLRDFTERNARNYEGFLELGNLLFEAGRLQEAITAFRMSSVLAPSLALAHRRLGETLLAIKQTEDALTSLQKAEELGDRGKETYQALARVYSEKRETAQETEARRKAMLAVLRQPPSGEPVRISPQDLQNLRREFVNVLRRRPPFASFQAEDFWERVTGSLSLPLTDKLEILRSVLIGSLEPSSIISLSRYFVEETEGLIAQFGSVAADLQKKISQQSIDPTVPEELLKLRSGNPTDAALLAILATRDKPPTFNSVALLEEAIRHDPTNNHILSLLGLAAGIVSDSLPDMQQKKELLEKSRQAFHQAIEFNNKNDIDASTSRDFYNLGRTLGKLADFYEGDEKRSLLYESCFKNQAAVLHRPDHHEALSNWATVLLKLSYTTNRAKSRKAFLLDAKEKAQRANAIQTGSGDYNLACALSLLGEFDEAERLITAELERSPDQRVQALADPDFAPLWTARPELRESISAAVQLLELPTKPHDGSSLFATRQ
jgi:tetratricopeptide (TPR) repeat protein